MKVVLNVRIVPDMGSALCAFVILNTSWISKETIKNAELTYKTNLYLIHYITRSFLAMSGFNGGWKPPFSPSLAAQFVCIIAARRFLCFVATRESLIAFTCDLQWSGGRGNCNQHQQSRKQMFSPASTQAWACLTFKQNTIITHPPLIPDKAQNWQFEAILAKEKCYQSRQSLKPPGKWDGHFSHSFEVSSLTRLCTTRPS